MLVARLARALTGPPLAVFAAHRLSAAAPCPSLRVSLP